MSTPAKLDLTGGSAAATVWNHGWGNVYSSAAGITIEQSPDDGANWGPAQKLDGTGPATSTEKGWMGVMLVAGMRTRAIGIGTATIFAGSAGTYLQPKAPES